MAAAADGDGDEAADVVLEYRTHWHVEHSGGGAGAPERRCWHAAALSFDRLYVGGGYSGFTYFGDLHCYDLAAGRWAASAAAEVMKPRYAHSLTAAPDDQQLPCVFAFGGARERLYFKHFQALPSDPAAIARISAEQALRPAPESDPRSIGTVGVRGGPSERAAHSVAVCNGLLYFFGGDAGKGIYHNDIHTFDPRTRVWTLLRTTGTAPSPRGWCTMSAVGTRLFLLFGTNGNDVFNEVHIFDTVRLEWSRAPVRGNEPLGRHSHCSCVRGDAIFVFGGVGERKRQLFGDINIFHTPSLRWIGSTLAPGLPPLEPRYGHTAVFWRRYMVVFGGCLLDPQGTRRYSNELLFLSFEMRPYLRNVPSSLVPDLSVLVANPGFFSDVTFVVDGHNVPAHKCILACRNEDFFRKMLLGPLKESSASVIPIPDMSHAVFVALLEYIYTGGVAVLQRPPSAAPTPEPLSISTSASTTSTLSSANSVVQLAADLLEPACMYNMQPLVRICCQRLINSISAETVVTIWQLGLVYSLKALRIVCAQFARTNLELSTITGLLGEIPKDEAEQFLAEYTMPAPNF